MIRLAFLGVFLLAGLLAFGAFSIARGTGEPTSEAPINAPVQTAVEPEPTVERVYFLADQDFEVGKFALVLRRAGPDRQDMVVTDAGALKTAQQNASIVLGNDITVGAAAVPNDQNIATLYRGGDPVMTLHCGSDTCDLTDDAVVDLAGLADTAQPLLQIDEVYGDYDAYLDAVAFVNATPEYAFLSLRGDGDVAHPVAQQTPTASLVLPTIYRFADAPLDVQTHTALLTALVQDALPDGASVTQLTITQHDPAILIELETGRPATRAGEPITFGDVVLYTPRLDVEGTAALPDETLESLTEDTLLRVDWEDAADAFVASLGLPCTECFGVQAVGDVFNRANVTAADPERYPLSYFDLREAP